MRKRNVLTFLVLVRLRLTKNSAASGVKMQAVMKLKSPANADMSLALNSVILQIP